MENFFLWLGGAKGQALVAGFLGGLVRWLALKEKWRDGVVSVTVGGICAIYLGPIAQPALEPVIGQIVIDETAQAGFSGFLIGMGGLSVAGLFIDFWRARRRRRNNE